MGSIKDRNGMDITEAEDIQKRWQEYTGENSIHGHHQIVDIKIRLMIFFAAEDGKALYGQQK